MLILLINILFKDFIMAKSRPISVRLEDDLLKLVREYSGVNFNAYLEQLILRGMLMDLADLHLTFKNSDSEINQRLQKLDAIKELQAGMVFLQEIIFKMALRQGFKEEELKQLHQAIQKKYEQ